MIDELARDALDSPPFNLFTVRHLFLISLACSLLAVPLSGAQEPAILHKEALPTVKPLVLAEPVPVPETIGAALLAGVGFFMLFRRNRYA